MDDAPVEKRRHKRLAIEIPIVVRGLNRNSQRFTENSKTLNGSISGVGFVLQQEPMPHSELVILIRHNLNVFQIRAQVRHVTPQDTVKLVGVQFLKDTRPTTTST